MEQCDHAGFHSGQGRYDMATERLRYVEVCDTCEGEVRELGAAEYRPRFDRSGTAAAGSARPPDRREQVLGPMGG